MFLPDFSSSPHYRTKDLIKIQLGRSDGFYEIAPLAENEIDLNEITSKKRAEAKRKQALLNNMYADLKTFFEEHRDDTSVQT